MGKMYVYITNIQYMYIYITGKKTTTVILSVARESFVQLFLEIL